MKPRYVICPGEVTSKNDGQRHYITADMLMRLYRVRPDECVIAESPRHIAMGLLARNLPHLYPNYDGNYTLPKDRK